MKHVFVLESFICNSCDYSRQSVVRFEGLKENETTYITPRVSIAKESLKIGPSSLQSQQF